MSETTAQARNIDREVAVKVFGITPKMVRVRGETNKVEVLTDNPYWLSDGQHSRDQLEAVTVQPYSTDATKALAIVELMNAKFGREPFVSKNTYILSGKREWHVVFGNRYEAVAETFPLAVCEAALKSVQNA